MLRQFIQKAIQYYGANGAAFDKLLKNQIIRNSQKLRNKMLKLKNSTRKAITYETETYSVDGSKNISICVSKQNGKVTDYYFSSKKLPLDSNSKEINLRSKFKYYYYDKKIFNEFKTKHFTDIEFEKFEIPFESLLKDEEKVDLSRVLCPYYNGHMVFCIEDLYPIPTVMLFDYVAGIDNEYYHVDKTLAHLKKNKFVLEVEEERIPSYNASANRTHGLKMKVLFSDEMFRKMWDSVKKTEFPSVRIKELVCCAYTKNTIDPLEVKKFLKSKKEIEMEREQAEEDEG